MGIFSYAPLHVVCMYVCVFESFTSECAFEWLLISIFRFAITLFTTLRILCERARVRRINAQLHVLQDFSRYRESREKIQRNQRRIQFWNRVDAGTALRLISIDSIQGFKHSNVSSFRMWNYLVISKKKSWLILTSSGPLVQSSPTPAGAIVMRAMLIST